MAATAPLAVPGPEEELLLCCARLRPGPQARRRTGELLAEPLDWVRLVRLALHHKVTPLLYRALARRVGVPVEIRDALRRHQAEQGRHVLALLTELQDLLDGFERQGIPAVPFKGPALAELAYGSVSARLSGDLDLLVRPGDVERVAAGLEARGYVEQTRHRTGRPLDAAEDAWYRHVQAEYVYLRPRDGMVVEPHWTLAPRPLAVELDMAGIWQRTRRFRLAGREVPGLALEDLVLALCVHGSKHEWTELRWICDIAELVARRPEIDWPLALERAQAQGCARMLRLGLALAERVLGEPLPEPARGAVEADVAVAALAAHVEARLFDADYDAPSVFRVSRFRLRMRERTRDRVACLARTLGTPQIAHVRLLRLPPALQPLYGVLTPAIDYLALPLQRRLATRRAGPARSRTLEAVGDAASSLASLLEAIGVEALEEGESALVRELPAGARLLAFGALPPGAGHLRTVAIGQGPGCPAMPGARAAAVALPFASGSFDAVLCRAAWLLWEDPVGGLREVHRAARSGARASVAAFAPVDSNPLLAAVDRTARELVGPSALPLAGLVEPFARRGAAAQLLRGAGFRRVSERTVWSGLEPVSARSLARDLLFAVAGLDPRQLPETTRVGMEQALAARLPEGVVRVGLRVALGIRRS